MKKVLYGCIILLGLSDFVWAQKSSPITLQVVSPAPHELMTEALTTALQNKLITVLAAGDIAEGGSTPFGLYPQVSVGEQSVVEGMQKMTVARFYLVLQVKNGFSKAVFATHQIELSGSGATLSEALRHAIGKVNAQDAQLQQFLTQAQTKIRAYYQRECSNLMAKADQQVKVKNYEAALATFYAIPQGTTCFEEASKKLSVVYLGYQNQVCTQHLQQAKSLAASREYAQALYYLGLIDRQAGCAREAETLLTKIGGEVSEENKKQWELIKQRQNNAVELEKIRLEIINSIVTNYYRHQIIVVGK